MVKTDEVQPSSSITGAAPVKGGFVPVYHVHVAGQLEKLMDETFRRAVVESYGPTAEGHDEYHQSDIERAYGLLVINMDKNRIAPADLDTSKQPDKALAYAYRCVCVCVSASCMFMPTWGTCQSQHACRTMRSRAMSLRVRASICAFLSACWTLPQQHAICEHMAHMHYTQDHMHYTQNHMHYTQ